MRSADARVTRELAAGCAVDLECKRSLHQRQKPTLSGRLSFRLPASGLLGAVAPCLRGRTGPAKVAIVALTEVREDQAPPGVAVIYDALRRGMGVPLVNLVYRHLATLPGVLPWVWTAIRPPLENGRLADARMRLTTELELPLTTPVPADVWCAAGLTPSDRKRIAALAGVYDRGNRSNLILLTALCRTIEDVPTGDVRSMAPVIPPTGMLPSPPPFPVFDDLPEDVIASLRRLAARHSSTSDVVPSLYVHLAHWPPFLARLPEWLYPAMETAQLSAGRSVAVTLAEREADALRPALDVAGDVPGGHGPAVVTVLRRFTRDLIPEMVHVGAAIGQKAIGSSERDIQSRAS